MSAAHTTIHVCAFNGTRWYPPKPEPIIASRRPGGPLETFEPAPARQPRCEHQSSRGQCTKTSTGYGAFVWGSLALCEKHLDEECGKAEP